MEPEKEQEVAEAVDTGQTETLDVKQALQPDEHEAYIAAVAEDPTATQQQPVVSTEQPLSESAATPAVPVRDESTAPPTQATPPNANSEPQPTVASRGFLMRIKEQPRKKKIMLAGVVLLLIVVGVFIAARLLSEGNVASLTPDSKNGIAFERPSNWQQSKEEDGLVYYTENDGQVSKMNRGMILGVQTLGVRYNTLAEEDKANIRKSFESEFSNSQALSGDQCEDITNIQTTELTQEGYDLAFKVDAECPQLKDGETGGKIKMFIGWKDVDLHVVGVVADSPTWEAEGDELEAIANSIRPE